MFARPSVCRQSGDRQSEYILYRGYIYVEGFFLVGGGAVCDPRNGTSQAWDDDQSDWDECVTNWTIRTNHGTFCVTRSYVDLKFHASFIFQEFSTQVKTQTHRRDCVLFLMLSNYFH